MHALTTRAREGEARTYTRMRVMGVAGADVAQGRVVRAELASNHGVVGAQVAWTDIAMWQERASWSW